MYVRNQETQTITLIYQFDNHRMTLFAFVVMYEILFTAFPDLKFVATGGRVKFSQVVQISF